MEISSDAHPAKLGSTHSLDVSKPTHLSRQGIASTNSNNSHSTPCGNIVIIENSLHNRGTPSSVIVPFNNQGCPGSVLPLSNKLKVSHKSVKTIPKITVNANNLQRLQQKGKTPQQGISKKSPVNDIDEDLGNILDIPIIFAKDDDNLNNIDKIPVVTQTTMVKEPQEKPKLNSTTKVVLISNKQDKLQQTQQGKLGASSTQAVICSANMPMQNLNHLILQARSQSNSNNGNSSNVIPTKNRVGVPMESRLVQPTVKYTKIILAKRNALPPQQSKRSEQVTTTKTSDDTSAPKILTFEKEDNRFVQASSSVSSYEDPFVGNVLEIEDAIKTNIIERRYTPMPAIDPASPITFADDDGFAGILDETKLDETQPGQPIFGKVDETQS